jgi:hypothetical protein
MPKARARAETLVPADPEGRAARDKVVDAVADDLRMAAAETPAPAVRFVQRTVDVTCPSGKHSRSLLTYRGYTMACMFCVPCEHGWTEPNTHAALRDRTPDSPR